MKQMRNTHQRQLIRELMEGNFSHPTADEIFELAREKDVNISRSTVYRNLNILAESGELLRLLMPIGPDHYDITTNHHYHFICRSCNSVFDTGIAYDKKLNETPPQLSDCKIEWHKLILVGLCHKCSEEHKA